MTTRWYTKDKVTRIEWEEVSDIASTAPESALQNLYSTAVQLDAGPPVDPVYSAYQIIVSIPFTQWLERTSNSDANQKTAEEIQQASENLSTPPVEIPPEIEKGTANREVVKQLQTLLNEKNNAGLKVDGGFGNQTKAAVIAYQQEQGITPADGKVTAVTWTRLLGIPVTVTSEGQVVPSTPSPTVEVVESVGDVVDPGNSSPNAEPPLPGQAGRFDPSKYDDPEFRSSLQTIAMDAYVTNGSYYPRLKELDPSLYENMKNNQLYVTKDFYITTGRADAGASILFRTLFIPLEETERQILQLLRPSPNMLGPYKETRAWNLLGERQGEMNPFSELKTILQEAHLKNLQLEDRYEFNFLNLANQVAQLHTVLKDKIYSGRNSANRRLFRLWEHQRQEFSIDQQAEIEGPPAPAPSLNLVELERKLRTEKEVIRFEFESNEGENFEMEKNLNDRDATGFARGIRGKDPKLLRMLMYYKEEVELVAPNTVRPTEYLHYKWKEGAVYVPGATEINDTIGVEGRSLLYWIMDWFKAWRVQKNTSGFDIHEFVNTWINPSPRRDQQSGTEPREATRVLNDGSTGYKNQSDLQREVLPVERMAIIHEMLEEEYYHVTDHAFRRVIENSHQIRTIEDIYTEILHVMPLSSIVSLATTCLSKYVSEDDFPRKACDLILGNMDFSELDQLLEYMGADTESAAGKLRAIILEEVAPEPDFSDGSYSGPTKNRIILEMRNRFQNDLDARDTLCAAIFASVLGASILLGALIGDVDLDTGIFERHIENPANEIYQQFANQINDYKVLALTADWGNQLKNTLIDLVTQLVAATVQQLISEISYMCEGSSKSDMANMNTGNAFINTPSGRLPPTFPFEPATIDNAIIDDTVYDDLNNFLNVPFALIEDFLSALSDLLTLSELCVLLNKGGSDTNKNAILNKVWFGLLELKKFSPLKEAIGNRFRLVEFFDILGAKTSQKYCVTKLENLENTKKLLSDLCGPPSNNALIEDLKTKATDAAIQNLLNQENKIADDLLDAIYKIQNPKAPPVFCGPESKNTKQEPLFSSQDHPSSNYLSNMLSEQVLGGIQLAFEKDVSFYKPLLTKDGLSNFAIASGEIPGYISKMYGIGNNNINTGSATKNQLDNSRLQYQFAAPAVYSALIDVDIDVDSQLASEFVETQTTQEESLNEHYMRIATGNDLDGFDVVKLDFNFSAHEINDVPPQSSRLQFGFWETPVSVINTLSNGGFPTVFNDATNTFNEDSSYDSEIQSMVTGDISFYSMVLEQIIKEHAEYIAKQGLFKRTFFDQLQLQKESLCDTSILDFTTILQDISINKERLQCEISIAAVPTCKEIAQIHAFVEIAIKTVIIQEYLKSLMVFSVFGITSLLPEGEDSFYYKYLISQVIQKIGKNTEVYIWKYSRLIYAVEKQVKVDDLSLEEVTEEIIKKHMPDVQSSISRKLEKVDFDTNTPGIQPNQTLKVDTIPMQILRNITTPKIFEPPKVLDVDVASKTITIPDGFYSTNERLKNGGFFVEEGFEVVHKHEGDFAAFTQEEYDELVQNSSNIGNGSPIVETVVHDSLIGKHIFGSVESQAAFQTKLELLTPTQLISFSEASGKLSRQGATEYLTVLDNLDSILDTLVPSAGSLKEQVQDLIEQISDKIRFSDFRGSNPNRFFEKFNSYKSLNLLIPTSIDGSGADANSIMISKYNDLINSLNSLSTFGALSVALGGGDPNQEGFFKSVLDRKYFLIEESGKNAYFKLPLLIFYNDKSAEESKNTNTSTVPFSQLVSQAKSGTETDPELETIILENIETVDKTIDGLERKDRQMYDLFKLGSFESRDLQGNLTQEVIKPIPSSQDPKGIWDLLNSKPVYTEVAGINPTDPQYSISDDEIFDIARLINLETGKGFHREGNVTATGLDGLEFQQSNATGLPVPSPLVTYWTGTRWVVVGAEPMAEKLELVWNAVEQFNASNQSVYKPYPRGNIESTFKIAEDKFALLGVETNSTSDVSDGLLRIKQAGKEWEGASLGETWFNVDGVIDFNLFEGVDKLGWVLFIVNRYTLSAEEAAKRMGVVKGGPTGEPRPYQIDDIDSPSAQNWMGLFQNRPNYYGVYSIIQAYSEAETDGQAKYELKFAEKVLESIANEPRFGILADSMQYKSLLSFISIMISELMERKYPAVESMFAQTFSTIQTSLNTLLNIANRANDPNFYQNTNFNQNAAANGISQNWAPMVLETILKSLANTTDPTWSTPWFSPGPLTPLGVVVKLLDSEPDDDNSGGSATPAQIASSSPLGVVVDTKCPPEEGNS